MKYTSLTTRLGRSFASLAITLSFCSCRFNPPAFPTTKLCNVTVYNSFASCHNPASSSAPLAYSGYIKVFGANGGTSPYTIVEHTWTVSKDDPSTPATFTIPVPSSGTFKMIVIEQATQCSTCAVTEMAGGDGGNINCAHNDVPNGKTAANPRLERHSDNLTYNPNMKIQGGLSDWIQTFDASTCGCIVSN